MSQQHDKGPAEESLNLPAHDKGNASKDASFVAPEKAEKTISCVSCRRRKLKCDRVKPSCATCLRAKQSCEYPERKRTVGSKRRNMRELEARLGVWRFLLVLTIVAHKILHTAQVETKLVAEVNKAKNLAAKPAVQLSQPAPELNNISMDFEFGNDEHIDPLEISDETPPSVFNIHAYGPTAPFPDVYSQELTSLGVEEPMPPEEMFHEL